jgi:hypothetical protein
MNKPEAPDIPAYAREVARRNLEAVREALCRFVEAARQTHNFVSQSADVAALGAFELHEMALGHATQHLQLSLELTKSLAEANGLEEVMEAQRLFAQLSVEAYARQVDELSRFAALFTPKTGPETDPDLL